MLVAGAYKGYQAKKLKDEEAKGIREAAGRTMAITTRKMQEEIRNKELMHSRAIAVAGASGAGTAGLTKLLGDLNTEGEYRVMSVLWNGLNEAEGLQYRAEAAEREGDAAQTAGVIDGITSAVSAYSGMGGMTGGGPGGAPAAISGAPSASPRGFGPAGTNYSPVPGGPPSLWADPKKIPTYGQFSPVIPPRLWGD
jgi:hypothetical protein